MSDEPVNEITITARVAVEVHEAEEGGYWGTVPALPGCISEGDTREELLANLKEAAELWLEPIPPAVARRIAAKRAKRAAAERATQNATPKGRTPKRTGS